MPMRAALLVLLVLLGGCATHGGHFYQNDGPPEHVPPGLASVPDAEPREEPLNPYANRPYKALGQTYTPDTSDAPFEQHGIASWYGRQYHGGLTASGERYDMFAMTAAHPTLPIPSYARVTRVKDGRSVVVRINDRGPFVHDRIIDLSYAAAVRLGLDIAGSGEVTVQRIRVQTLPREVAAAPGTAEAPPAPPAVLPVATASVPAVTVPAPTPVAATPTPSAPATSVAPAPATAMPAVPAPGWSVQVGAFAVAENAASLRDQLAALLAGPAASGLPAQARSVRIEQHGRLLHVLIGMTPDKSVAQAWAAELARVLARETVLYFH